MNSRKIVKIIPTDKLRSQDTVSKSTSLLRFIPFSKEMKGVAIPHDSSGNVESHDNDLEPRAMKSRSFIKMLPADKIDWRKATKQNKPPFGMSFIKYFLMNNF